MRNSVIPPCTPKFLEKLESWMERIIMPMPEFFWILQLCQIYWCYSCLMKICFSSAKNIHFENLSLLLSIKREKRTTYSIRFSPASQLAGMKICILRLFLLFPKTEGTSHRLIHKYKLPNIQHFLALMLLI